MEGRKQQPSLSLNAALDLMYPDTDSVEEGPKEKKRGKEALEEILTRKKSSKDSNDIAEAAEAAYYLGLFVLQEKPIADHVIEKKSGIKETLSEFLTRLSGGAHTEISSEDPYNKAIEWFKQAIELGGDFLYGNAVFLLALLYKRKNKNELSNAYLLWAAYSGNQKAQDAWMEELEAKKEAGSEELKLETSSQKEDLPNSTKKGKTDEERKVQNPEASPTLRQLISSIRPKRQLHSIVRRIIVRNLAIKKFKSTRLNTALRKILEETGSIQSPDLTFNEQVNTAECALDVVIKEKLIASPKALPSGKRKGILAPKPLRGSYLKDILTNSTNAESQQLLSDVLPSDRSSIQQITGDMGKIGVKFYYLAQWWLENPTKVTLQPPASQPQPSVNCTKREKELLGKSTLNEAEALELCRIGEKYYREGIKQELKERESGINKISTAAACFKAAANANCRDAVFNFGVVYENAWRLLDKPEANLSLLDNAATHYEKASEAGCAEASYALSEIYGLHFQRIRQVKFAIAARNYFATAQKQGYLGSGSGARKTLVVNSNIVLQLNEEEKKSQTNHQATFSFPSAEYSTSDEKQQEKEKESLSLINNPHIVNSGCPTNTDEEELVASLFASRPVGIFSGWSKDTNKQKKVNLKNYILHAQGSSCFYSGNSSYQSIQSLFQKLNIDTDIRKPNNKNKELPDAVNTAGTLLAQWFAKKQEIKQRDSNEKEIIKEIFKKHTSSWRFSGWSESNKKYATLESYIAYARRGAGLYSGSRSYQALNDFMAEAKLGTVPDIRTSNGKTDKQIAEDILMEWSNRKLLSGVSKK